MTLISLTEMRHKKNPEYSWHTSSPSGQEGMPKGGLRPQKPRIMPGLPKGAFSENRVKCPDSICGQNDVISPSGVHFGVFKIWASFLSGAVDLPNGAVRKKRPSKTQYGALERIVCASILGYSGDWGVL